MILWKYLRSGFACGNTARPLLIASVITSGLAECDSTYKPIQPYHIRTMESGYTYCCDSVYVQWKYHVLYISGNDAFALEEMQHKPIGKACLLGFHVEHYGTDTLRFPEDFRFLDEERLRVVEPLTMMQAYRRLKRIRDDYGDEWWHEIIELFTNKDVTPSNKAFKQDLRRLYLSSIEIVPDSSITGLLALPVNIPSPLDVVCKSDVINWKIQGKK